jgi:uncharacterized protein YndB with AHSA1/START domain
MSDLGTVLQLRRRFRAPRDLVFAAWTEPEKLEQWFRVPGASKPSASVDLRVGGDYTIAGERDGLAGRLAGTFLEVRAPERLVYTFRWEPVLIDAMDTGETLVTVEFRDLGDQTEVVLVHERLRADREVRGFHEWGWAATMDQLEQMLGAP